MKKENLKAIFFDFDDTLQSRKGAYRLYCECFLTKYFPEISEEERLRKLDEMAVDQVGDEALGGHHVGHFVGGHDAVVDGAVMAVPLTLIPVGLSVEGAVQVVLIIAPGDAGHQMDHVARLPVFPDPPGHGIVGAVDHGEVRGEVRQRTVRRGILKAGQLFSPVANVGHRSFLLYGIRDEV